MEFVEIFNGLGNQMSQYAFYLSKKKSNPHCRLLVIDNPEEHNGYELKRIFAIDYRYSLWERICLSIYKRLYLGRLRSFACKIGIQKIFEPQNYDYTPQLHNKHSGIKVFWGGWHSEKNFLDVEEDVRKIFTFPVQNDTEYNSMLDNVRKEKNSVSIHVRRGDYLNIPKSSYYQFAGVATDEYYQQAIQYINEHIVNPVFYVFSNDIEWCKQNIHCKNVIFVTCNTGLNSWRDMQLMAECRHHIIANSSFSWWGAWLSKYDNIGITIRPKWFIRNVITKDVYPERWIVI